MPKNFRLFIKLLIWAVLALAAGYAFLITPDNPVLRIFRGEISDISADVIIGPYPLENDIKRLRDNGVGTIVSLLDPALPYENQLLEQEKELAKQHGMQLLNFPMASILGQKLGNYYENNASAAAEAIAAAKGKVYLHCYLGIHRVATVKKLLETRQIKVGRYTLQEGERSPLAMQLDAAEKNYHEGRYQQAQQLLNSMKKLSPAAILLHGWVDFRLGDIETARKYFASAALALPQSTEPLLGLAYCDLRDNALSEAEAKFRRIIGNDTNDVEALSGMGLTLFRQGNLPEAADYLRKALQINPQHPEAKDALQRIETKLKP